MAAAMKLLVEDPDLANQLGRKGREQVKNNFSMDRSIEKLWEVLHDVIETKV
jgi:glycosyltransferase involved in cell wall biosynthesis